MIATDNHAPEASVPPKIWVRDRDAECEKCDQERKGFRHVPGQHTCGHSEDSGPYYASIRERYTAEAKEMGYCSRCTGSGWVQQYSARPPYAGAVGFTDTRGTRYVVPCGCGS